MSSSKIRPQTYAKRYDELKEIHRFTFRKRKNFTPSQKAAITRLHKQHRHQLSQLEIGRGIFKPLKPAKIRALKKAALQEEGFTITNKGIIVKGVRKDLVKKGVQKVRITGKGKNIKVSVSLPSRLEKFFPYVDESEPFPDFVKRLIKKYSPDELLIQNESGRGRDRYTPLAFSRYINRDIQPRIDNFRERYDRNPFVGVWLIWYKHSMH